MSKRREEATRQEMIGILDAVEIGLAEFARIFREVEHGAPLDTRRAHHLGAQSTELLNRIVEIRNAIRLSAAANGIH